MCAIPTGNRLPEARGRGVAAKEFRNLFLASALPDFRRGGHERNQFSTLSLPNPFPLTSLRLVGLSTLSITPR
jgi:hypothetical protein